MALSLLLGKYCGSSLPSSFNKLRSFSSKSYFFSKPTTEGKDLLEVKDLTAVDAESKQEVLKGVNFLVREGEIHEINNHGPGKSIFLKVLFGDPQYQVTQGSIIYRGWLPLVDLPSDRRSITGGLMSFKPIPYNEPTEDIKPVKKPRKGKKVFCDELQAGVLGNELQAGVLGNELQAGDVKKRKNGKQVFCNELQAGVLGNDLGVLDGVKPRLLDEAEMEGVVKGLNNLLLPRCPSLTVTHFLGFFKVRTVNSHRTHRMVDGRIISPPLPDLSIVKRRDRLRCRLDLSTLTARRGLVVNFDD